MKAAEEYHDKTMAPNQMWQTDFTYFKIIGWGWFYRKHPAATTGAMAERGQALDFGNLFQALCSFCRSEEICWVSTFVGSNEAPYHCSISS